MIMSDWLSPNPPDIADPFLAIKEQKQNIRNIKYEIPTVDNSNPNFK